MGCSQSQPEAGQQDSSSPKKEYGKNTVVPVNDSPSYASPRKSLQERAPAELQGRYAYLKEL